MSSFPQRFGAYALAWPLKPGGMGDLFLAIDGRVGADANAVCVLKRMLPELLQDEIHLRRFRREAELAVRLVHPNLARTLEVGDVDGEPFFAQELVEGHDVSEIFARCSTEERHTPVGVVVHIAREVARGLAYVHQFEGLGLVHRDVTPGNIKVTYGGDVKLLDFGLARSADADRLTAPGTQWGKLPYMAPEQLRDRPLDRRTDLYALGIMIWELLTGRPIGTTIESGRVSLPTGDRREVVTRILSAVPPPPSLFNASSPKALDEFVAKAVAKAPEARFQTAEELEAALGPFLLRRPDGHVATAAWMNMLFEKKQERTQRNALVAAARQLFVVDGPSHSEMSSPTEKFVSPAAIASLWLRHRKKLAMLAILGTFGAGVLVAAATRKQPPSARPALPVAAAGQPEQPASPPGVAPSAMKPTRRAARAKVSPVEQAQREPRPRRPTMPPEPAPAGSPGAQELELARTAFAHGDFDTAIGQGRAAIALGSHEGHAIIGAAYFKLERFAEAEREYAEALRHDPSNATLARRLAFARQKNGNSPHDAQPGL